MKFYGGGNPMLQGQSLLRLPLYFLVILLVPGCIAAAPLVVKHFKGSKHAGATFEIDKSAPVVYDYLVKLAEKRQAQGKLSISARNDKDYYVQITDGVRTAGVKVVWLGTDRSQVVIAADPGNSGETKEDIALRIVNALSKEAGFKYVVVE